VKCNLPEYSAIEEKLQGIIYDKFGLGDLSDVEKKLINEVDDTMLYFEFEALMDSLIFETPPYKAIEHDFLQRDFVNVEKEFISTFNRITGKQNDWASVGIDGCKGGWIAVSTTNKGFEIGIYKSIGDFFSKYDGCDSMIIDMPIGLPESAEDIRPDSAARLLLPGKTSSIFNTPCRQAVSAKTYSEANEINKQVMGKGLSAQSYAICGKIKEIDEFLNNNFQYKNRLLESHPELCFAMLNSGEPLHENKKTYEGTRKRIELLSRYYDKTEGVIAHASSNQKLRNLMDDVVDALCLAVTGMIGLENGLKSIPEEPMMDAKGLLMQMVYP
jgi:predicted RNase H-like nuclease